MGFRGEHTPLGRLPAWPGLCQDTDVDMDPDTQEVEHLALPAVWLCVAGAPRS